MPHAGDDSLTLALPDEAATLALGARLAAVLRPGMTVYLSGDLGAGKTTLTRGLLRSLGYAGRVKSPTYTLVELYEIPRLNLYHFDLYRFADPVEWAEAGFREYFNADTVCLVEWPEKAAGLLPGPDLTVRLDILAEGRTVRVSAGTEVGRRCVEALKLSSSA